MYNKAFQKNKQYLKITFPSYKRAIDYLNCNLTKEIIVEDDWVDADLEKKTSKK